MLGRCIEGPILSTANAKIGMIGPVMLDKCFQKAARHLEECVDFAHVNSVTRS